MFNWKCSTKEECAWEMARRSPQAVTALLKYYTIRNDAVMIAKLKEARLLAKRYRKILIGRAVENEIIAERLDNATNPTGLNEGLD